MNLFKSENEHSAPAIPPPLSSLLPSDGLTRQFHFIARDELLHLKFLCSMTGRVYEVPGPRAGTRPPAQSFQPFYSKLPSSTPLDQRAEDRRLSANGSPHRVKVMGFREDLTLVTGPLSPHQPSHSHFMVTS